ncbi:hypothetical protein HY250_01985 [Candidatus Azambacteria bacterium]|nr:hypothetical protein [Candidatus Azambacteria bacterium]
MMKFSRFGGFLAVAALFVAVAGFASIAFATHSWGTYHWARTANPLALKLGDDVSSAWDAYLATASSDWSAAPAVLGTTVVAGSSDPKKCRAVSGRVEVCNRIYGNNGWLGVASIWVNGNHITQGTVKLNDTYFNTSYYNTPAWRQMVVCQEVGHTFGLDHQDTNFYNANLGTCMDYTSDPSTNQHPNQHDYDQLAAIYTHLDSFTSAFSKALSARGKDSKVNDDDIDTLDAKEWGKEVRKSSDGRSSLHERDLGKGNKLFTFVIWAN